MGQSYRIKATPGKDQNIVLPIEQDFEQLEILSLKIRQTDIYLRMCSEFGIVAGRVFANNGYGIPNAKLSIFIPVTDQDLKNPTIESIYPYKNLTDINEDGYKYNLLPYTPSYDGHTPTGTFPTRLDVLTNQTVVQLYDKYYKYTVQTNDSGDYMIYGVPLGTQTLVMNLDLSDMGPFSLGPQDLVRMGRATEDQLDGAKFKSSPNFGELPQIVVINKTVEVIPFWGENEICQVGITRSDFDITSELGIDIKPTAIFMGSIFSSSEKTAVRVNNKVRKNLGALCKLIPGPGEIIAISQTVYQDNNGLPILERAKLPNGGKVIDGDGAWVMDLPMNLDYVYTDEYGNQKISNDPKVGVPTKAKYRFKVKWKQSNRISEDYKRGYWLVPNIKEKGWITNFSNIDPMDYITTSVNYRQFQTSYAFSLDWADYTHNISNISPTNPDILEAINCEDRFYEFHYNKVYTVSMFLDYFKGANNRERFTGIKQIEDSSCESNVNRFPVNDGVFHTTILYVITNILMTIIGIILIPLLVIYHFVAWIWNNIILGIVKMFFPKKKKEIGAWEFGALKFPMITYPDCDACDCSGENSETPTYNSNVGNPIPGTNSSLGNFGMEMVYDLSDPTIFSNCSVPMQVNDWNVLAGNQDKNQLYYRMPVFSGINATNTSFNYYSKELTLAERINKFNTKQKYFDGVNQIKVRLNPGDPSNAGKYHYDNVIAILCNPDVISSLSVGSLFSFVGKDSSLDLNLINGISGTRTNPTSVNIIYGDSNIANNLQNLQTTYVLPTSSVTNTKYMYASDIEYFQVLYVDTLNNFYSECSSSPLDNTFAHILKVANQNSVTNLNGSPAGQSFNISSCLDKTATVLICQRGVDPYSPLYPTEIDFSKLFGYNSWAGSLNSTKNINLRLNVPTQNPSIPGNRTIYQHNFAINNTNGHVQSGSLYLFHPSYCFVPNSTFFSGFSTTNLNYYSDMDYDLSYQVDGTPNTNFQSDVSSGLILNTSIVWTSVNNEFNWVFLPYEFNYRTYESLAGGSYMYLQGTKAVYYSHIYNVSNSIQIVDLNRIVVRADRLPSGDIFETVPGINRTLLLQQNNQINFYVWEDDGLGGGAAFGGVSGANNVVSAPPLNTEPLDPNTPFSNVLNTFDCSGMVQLNCYDGATNNSFAVDSTCAQSDAVENGCYIFVKKPLRHIGQDIKNMSEYIFRFKLYFGLCQGAIGTAFFNNWVNGTLYSFPFKVDTLFDKYNKVRDRKYPYKLVMLHDSTNNFYYRSSPYDDNIKLFLGSQDSNSFVGTNVKNIKYPTTILDMGPKYEFLQQVTLSNSLGGYNMKKITSTSYNDLDDLINFFVISRIFDGHFFQGFVLGGSIGIRAFFSRPGQKVDGDFAQLAAINSQIGVIPLSNEYYTSAGGSPSLIVVAGSTSVRVIGVFYESTGDDIQVRDLISPKRYIRIGDPTLGQFAYDYLPVNTQTVPFYRWQVINTATIFGSQTNNWYTQLLPTGQFSTQKYQQLDRLVDQYPRYNYLNQYSNRGYLYHEGNIQSPSPLHTFNPALVGAPWYFYFGVVKGQSAMDKFSAKYIGEIVLNEQ